ncbi:response regulator transcription factor [Sulfitobacter pacificus]|uniref:response regulator transcription factor n=1 Tax=Sulfitobacter pacificus TaxID=1499314 RepID=UPI0024E0E7E6|nr:response regulator transcription factor [Sulfitobacter pacificus]
MSHRKPTSLLVSSESGLKNPLSYLASVVLKHDFEAVEDGAAAEEILSKNVDIDAVIVHLPGMEDDALELIRLARGAASSPVIIVLGSDRDEFCVQAFFAGANDVVAWPCSLRELAVRLFVRLDFPLNTELLQADDGSWDAQAYIADRAGLTISEAQVMHVLYAHDGETVSRDALSLAVDARPWRYGDRKFDVHVAKLRKKLSDSFGDKVSVSTIRSLGYRLVTNSANIFDPA